MKHNFNYEIFVDLLNGVKAVTAMQCRMIRFLEDDLKIQLSDSAKMLFLFLMIRESQGSTLISLENGVAAKIFNEYLSTKKSLFLEKFAAILEEHEMTEGDISACVEECFSIAIAEIKDGKYAEIVSSDGSAAVPFINQNNRLFIQKYFSAKVCIENRINDLFKKQTVEKSFIESIQKESKDVLGYELKEKQAEAVAKGSLGSLIVTGGPGTGKTTVVFSILRSLLKKGGVKEILLAAPSGKAADRMNESLGNAVKHAKDENLDWSIMPPAKTIHRMLKYNPGSQNFGFNEDNQLPDNSVIVIDEASMVDINLFAALLKAVPSTAKLFLLGDEHQLPSVDAGAVLGSLLAQKEDAMVKLNESNRFDGKLLEVVDDVLEVKKTGVAKKFDFEMSPDKIELQNFLNESLSEGGEICKKNSKVTFFEISQGKRSELSKAQENILKSWYEKFYAKASNNFAGYFAEGAEHVFSDEILECMFKEQLETARILCAEHQSRMGINLVNEFLLNKIHPAKKDGPFFAGEMLMLTRNMEGFGVFNGDVGLVISEKNAQGEESLQLVFSKEKKYKRFALSDFDYSSLVPAYAMTIHKSQGSEFGHVLMFLPESENHPLMSNEIIYTGISRAKYSCIVISNQEAFEKGLMVAEKRDTGINLSKN